MPRVPARVYRPDIDGLRAIAVLAVICYHVDERALPGGFVGVDIFFVISGFLISRNILSELARGRFSLAEFYRRRVKRIVPAMMLVIAVTTAAAQWVMLPQDAVATAHAALASIVGLANVYFWLFLDTSYFAADAGQAPLLHLWTLGVEEQFYLLWPLFLLLGHRRVIALPWQVLALAAALSFAAGTIFHAAAPTFVFYMLPTRAGELLAGALLAMALARAGGVRLGARASGLLGLGGLALLAVSLTVINEQAAFPGLLALVPTAGSMALILAGAGEPGLITRVLGAAPLRWVGLLSYSAYLWHWPLLAFLRYGHGSLNAATAAGALGATFLLAYLSYRYVETPCRATSLPPLRVFRRQYLAPAGAIAALAIASAWAGGYGPQVLNTAYRDRLQMLDARLRPPHADPLICQRQRLTPADLDDPACLVGADGATGLLWGDSNASHYVGVIEAFADAAGFGFRNAASQSCPPIAGEPRPYVYDRDLANCRASLETVRARLDDYDLVMLAASWPGYVDMRGDFLGRVFELAAALSANDTRVVLLGKAPVPDGFDRHCEAKALRFPGLDCDRPGQPLAPDIAAVNERLRAFAATRRGVDYFDLTAVLCPGDRCTSMSADGDPLYVDPHHLSLTGARELGRGIVKRDGVPAAFAAYAAARPAEAGGRD